MRAEFHNELRDPETRRASRIVVYDDLGNVVVVVGRLNNRTILTAKVTDPDFAETVKTLGLDKTVMIPIVTDITPKQIHLA